MQLRRQLIVAQIANLFLLKTERDRKRNTRGKRTGDAARGGDAIGVETVGVEDDLGGLVRAGGVEGEGEVAGTRVLESEPGELEEEPAGRGRFGHGDGGGELDVEGALDDVAREGEGHHAVFVDDGRIYRLESRPLQDLPHHRCVVVGAVGRWVVTGGW